MNPAPPRCNAGAGFPPPSLNGSPALQRRAAASAKAGRIARRRSERAALRDIALNY